MRGTRGEGSLGGGFSCYCRRPGPRRDSQVGPRWVLRFLCVRIPRIVLLLRRRGSDGFILF